ncbi:LysM peptidoglycan-binding domain-containing protein, partial [Ectothiorhodospiraceae bacterium WFHF3C12]|nr:LysM peptidoglycan-binding domain-containing protein [Ectothiorhodospiraceae bacterium WFHF3C12]
MRFMLAVGLAWALVLSVAPLRAEEITVPEGMADQVEFWKRVYTEVGTDGGLLHDSANLSVVYEVIRFPEKLRTRSQRQRYVDRFKAEYREILGQLAEGKREGLTPAQRRVLELWPDDVSNATLSRARSRLRFQLGQSDKFREGLVRSGAWEPHIRRTLKAMGLPEELAALPHVESSFNPRARSRVGAAGLWQFTRTTGRRYMRVDHVVDERMDPFLSSLAAARLLEHNHSVLGSWPLAITAYNHGAAGMRRAVRTVGTDDLAVIVDRYRGRTFGFASRNFYAAFLAAAEVDFHFERYFGDLKRDDPVRTTSLEVPDYVPAKALAAALDVEMATLRAHNPALLDPVWEGNKRVPRGFELRLPRGAAAGNPSVRLAGLDADQRYDRQIPDRFHTVRRGQTLSAIAARYGVRTTELVSLNNLRSRNLIRAGQVLRLPGEDLPRGESLTAESSGPAEPVPESGVYEVRQGDSLWEIARRYDMHVARLVELNDISADAPLRVGKTLRLRPRPDEDGAPA